MLIQNLSDETESRNAGERRVDIEKKIENHTDLTTVRVLDCEGYCLQKNSLTVDYLQHQPHNFTPKSYRRIGDQPGVQIGFGHSLTSIRVVHIHSRTPVMEVNYSDQ
jgi:hypothetical protein